MILKDTILSAFNDRGTLLKWLKQVEKALQADTLEDISLTQISDTEVKIRLTFADKQFVESPVLTMPRGPQGVKGDKGDKGDTGATGATGVTPNISVTAEELPAESPPTATRSGTNENPLITFGIPGTRPLYLHTILTDTHTFYVLNKLESSYAPNAREGKVLLSSIAFNRHIGYSVQNTRLAYDIAIAIEGDFGDLTKYPYSPKIIQKGNAISYFGQDGQETTILSSNFGTFVSDTVKPYIER